MLSTLGNSPRRGQEFISSFQSREETLFHRSLKSCPWGSFAAHKQDKGKQSIQAAYVARYFGPTAVRSVSRIDVSEEHVHHVLCHPRRARITLGLDADVNTNVKVRDSSSAIARIVRREGT